MSRCPASSPSTGSSSSRIGAFEEIAITILKIVSYPVDRDAGCGRDAEDSVPAWILRCLWVGAVFESH